ncbi:MAG: hypothetical protein Fur0022_44270 [Anaerolineales bacterium]
MHIQLIRNAPLRITYAGHLFLADPCELIIMDIDQTLTVCRTAPRAKVVAIHLEALDHCTVSRKVLRQTAAEAGLAEQLVVLADGEAWEYL